MSQKSADIAYCAAEAFIDEWMKLAVIAVRCAAIWDSVMV
jgi:hypothetical protein